MLNQYPQRTVPGFVDIVGLALATNPVYVNGQMASRKGEYFRRELSVNNATAPVWQQVTVTATGETPVTGNVFVPRTPEPFGYDLDGNLTSDGRWTYMWDAENRLIRVQSRSDTPQASWRRVEWQYDALGRRIRQTTWMWNTNSGTWQVGEDLKFVSDPLFFGRHIVELRATDNALVRSYVWGLDLSGTMDGAGGVGGLLWLTHHTGPNAGTHFAAYDGNGNIVALSAASDGSVSARYEYGPFAEPIRLTGPAAAMNRFRFSTKRTDPTTDLVLYEYRAYSPSLGRWLSRDPIEEEGGVNLVVVDGNDFLNWFDVHGTQVLRWKVKRVMPLDDSCNYRESDSGYGGVLWTIRWIITARGTAYDYHVAASGEAEASRFRTKKAEVIAWVFFGCDQGGNIIVTSMRPGGVDKNGPLSATASAAVQISGDTATVEYTSGAAWESGLSISPGIGIWGATISVTASSGGSGKVGKGWAVYKCVCSD